MISFILAVLSSTKITPPISIAIGLELAYILIRFLLIIFPKEHKFHKFLERLFRGLKEVEDDLLNLSDPEDPDEDEEGK